VPVTSKACPIVTLAHGFARSRVMMRDWGKPRTHPRDAFQLS
jgi:hypothetical protein